MHHAGRELANGREFLRVRQPRFGFLPRRHVLADGNDVRDVAPAEPQRNLGDPVRARGMAVRAVPRRLGLVLMQLTRCEHRVVFPPQRLRALAVEHLEDRAAEGFAARDALETGLARVVPCLDPILAIDDVESHGERIDDLFNEVALRFDFAGARAQLTLQLAKRLAHGIHDGRRRVVRRAGDALERGGQRRERAPRVRRRPTVAPHFSFGSPARLPHPRRSHPSAHSPSDTWPSGLLSSYC